MPLVGFSLGTSTLAGQALGAGRTDKVSDTDEMVAQVDEVLQARHLARAGDEVIIVAGMPPGTPGSTNSIRVYTVGETVDYRF